MGKTDSGLFNFSEEERKRIIEDLKKAIGTPDIKKREEWTIELEFSVLEADYTTIGDPTQRYEGNHALFKVQPSKKDIPIKYLEFRGFTFIQAGDNIRTQIYRYDEVRGENTGKIIQGEYVYGTNYVERDFKEKESVSKIEKIVDNKISATFKGLDIL